MGKGLWWCTLLEYLDAWGNTVRRCGVLPQNWLRLRAVSETLIVYEADLGHWAEV